MRFLSILLNPIGNLVWWLAKSLGGGIDRQLGPRSGWLFAWAIVLVLGSSLAGAAYGVREQVAKLTGFHEREVTIIVKGRIVAAETVSRKTMTITQDLTAEYESANGVRRTDGTLTEPSTNQKNVGDIVDIYLASDGSAGLRNPEDPYIDAFLTAIALGIPALGLVFASQYLRYRSRLRQVFVHKESSVPMHFTPSPASLLRDDIVTRGRGSVKSRDQRLHDEVQMIRQMHEKAAQRVKR